MAGAVISAFVDQFVSRSLQKIEEEVRLVKDAKKDVEKLKKSLRFIQAVLKDAEKKDLNSEGFKVWLSNLEDLSYDMDNVLDEWNTAILKSETEKQEEKEEEEESDHVGPPKKVCFPSCSSFKQVKHVFKHRDFAIRIKELNEELDRIRKDGNDLGMVVTRDATSSSASHGFVKPKVFTTSFVDETEVHGRDEEKKLLVSKVLSEGREIDIIPIVGKGGLGKTTLAQLVYNDEAVKTHFEKRVWVCVSDPFDNLRISKASLEGLLGEAVEVGELQSLHERINGCVKGKRFLFVFDDVWTRDGEEWERLMRPLRDGALGSKIIVTTRNEGVAAMMRAKSRMITLQEVSSENCWLIIKNLAFKNTENEDSRAELEVIGRSIAEKCKGFPLVARLLGGLLYCKNTRSEWNEILHNDLWKSVDVFVPFQLSYNDLSPLEKCCFSYCSVFPKDHEIERDVLIELWMSQGYFNEWNEGRDCFDNLAMRSFFQDFNKRNKYVESTLYCKMHDLVHDFGQSLMKSTTITLNENDVKREVDYKKARHLTLRVKTSPQFLSLRYENNLRTLFVENENLNSRLFHSSTRLRALLCENPQIFCSDTNFARFIHLRFLDISRNRLSELPESLSDLCNLQTLNLKYCHSLRNLPEGIHKLVSLRHLYIDGCFQLEGLPKGIRKLTGLRKLDMLVIPENKVTYFVSGDLKELNHLQFKGSLSICFCQNFRTMDDDVGRVNLGNMTDLDSLHLQLGHDYQATIDYVAILEVLKPHPNLKILEVSNYMGTMMSPSWMTSLINLRCIYLTFCPNCTILPPLGKLACLESLTICRLDSVEMVGLEFLWTNDGGKGENRDSEKEITKSDQIQTALVSFPKLKQLSFGLMTSWKKWEGTSIGGTSFKVMPCLRSLTLVFCPSLEAFPDFLHMVPLKDLTVADCSILQQNCQKGTGKEWLNISHIPNIKLGDKYVQKDGTWTSTFRDDFQD